MSSLDAPLLIRTLTIRCAVPMAAESARELGQSIAEALSAALAPLFRTRIEQQIAQGFIEPLEISKVELGFDFAPSEQDIRDAVHTLARRIIERSA